MKWNVLPYEGSESYIFISYCHRDRDFVFPILEELQKSGYRIWFDRGINPGNDWPDVIAEHLKKSEIFISFLSEQSVASHNCRREWNYAVAEDKPTVPVFIEKVIPTPAMKMQLASLQALLAYELDSKGKCIEKICSLPVLQKCLGETAVATPDCLIIYLAEDGETVVQSGEYQPGSIVSAPPAPVKEPNGNNIYTFDGWKLLDGEDLTDGGACVGDASFIATYNEVHPCSLEQSFDEIESGTEIINAWLIPDDKTRLIVTIGTKRVLIGHNSTMCDYVLDAPLISRSHALIRCNGFNCYLKDSSSGNATFVNGERIAPGVEEQVYHDDIIAFGGEKFQLKIPKNKKPRNAKCHRIAFYSEGSVLIGEENYRQGDVVEFPVAPDKRADETYRYTFLEWKLLSGVTLGVGNTCAGEANYAAIYSKEKITYTVGYFDENGIKSISSAPYHYGERIAEPVAPEKKEDEEYQYAFAGWTLSDGKTPGPGNVCMGNATFRATYQKKARKYRVTYFAEDGVTVISSATYSRGDAIELPANPQGTMLAEFNGWKLVGGTALENGKICAGDVEYKAEFRESGTEIANGFLARLKTKEVIPIRKELLLGSSPGAGGYTISDANSICAEHVKIISRGFQNFLLNLSDKAATLVNKTRIAAGEEVLIYHNDTITLGEEDFRLITNDKKLRPQQVKEKKIPYLILTDSGSKIEIDHTPFTLGRSSQKSWNNLTVGRQHSTIIIRGEKYFIADLPPYSINGTYLNGELLKKGDEYPLHSGDELRLADVKCRFIVE